MAFKYITICALFLCFAVSTNASGVNFHDRDHLQSHMEGELDLSMMSEKQLKFLYFKSHDTESNNKLDGCELVQSLLHFHGEDSLIHGEDPRIFSDAELSMMIDPILATIDKNLDGFIDYPEFAAGPGIIGYWSDLLS